MNNLKVKSEFIIASTVLSISVGLVIFILSLDKPKLSNYTKAEKNVRSKLTKTQFEARNELKELDGVRN